MKVFLGITEKGTQTAGSSTYDRSARLLLARSTLSLEVEAHGNDQAR